MESGIMSWEHKALVNLEQRRKSQGCHLGGTLCELGPPHNGLGRKDHWITGVVLRGSGLSQLMTPFPSVSH